MNEYRSRIFDGNPRISPFFIMLMTFGIIFMGAFPPVGLILIVCALTFQKRFRARRRVAIRAARDAELERRQRERHRALLSFPA